MFYLLLFHTVTFLIFKTRFCNLIIQSLNLPKIEAHWQLMSHSFVAWPIYTWYSGDLFEKKRKKNATCNFNTCGQFVWWCLKCWKFYLWSEHNIDKDMTYIWLNSWTLTADMTDTTLMSWYKTELILRLHPANESWRYKVKPSLIGWTQT